MSIALDTNAKAEAHVGKPERIRAWDLPTRLFHWGLLALIVSSWASSEYSDDPYLTWHKRSGYAILTLLVFRLVWGFVGGSTSRLSAFLNWPWTAARYAVDLFRGRARKYLSHNPLGTWMIIALFVTVSVQATAGLFTPNENFVGSGPLSDVVAESTARTMSWLHRRGFNVLLALAALHITVNLTYQFIKRDPIVAAMITGQKPRAGYEDQAQATGGSVALAALVLAGSAALVLGTIWLAGGTF